MTKLRDWVLANTTSLEKFSFKHKISYRYFLGILKGEYIPSRKMALKIEKATHGEISASEILFPSKSHATMEDSNIKSER